MAVKYAGGGGGLFSGLLPKILGLAGNAMGGPVGAAIGQGLGGMAGGQNPLEAMGGAALNYAVDGDLFKQAGGMGASGAQNWEDYYKRNMSLGGW